jgi:hypothetical protein
MPPPLSRLPWGLAQEEFGILGADLIASLMRLVLRHAKDLIALQVSMIAKESQKEHLMLAKDQWEPHLTGFMEESTQVARAGLGAPKDEIRPPSG